MDVVSSKSVSMCKSWKNSYLIALYAARRTEASAENYSILEEELADIFESMDKLEKDPVITICGSTIIHTEYACTFALI